MKQFNLRVALMSAVVSLCLAFSASAQRTYYIACDTNGWPFISTSNQEKFDGYTLTETAENSNVFKGTVVLNKHNNLDWIWMRVFAQLYDEDEKGNIPDYAYTGRKIFVPGTREQRNDPSFKVSDGMPSSDGMLMNVHGEGVFTLPMFYEEVCNPQKYDHSFSIRVPLTKSGEYDVTYDQNTEMFSIVSKEQAKAIVFDGEATPTIDTWNRYLNSGTSRYVAKGDNIAFRYFSLADGKYYGNESDENVPSNGDYFHFSILKDNGGKYILTDWPGGVLRLNERFLYKTPDVLKTTPIDVESIYMRGDFSEWEALDEYLLTRNADGKFYGTLPKGTERYKFADDYWTKQVGWLDGEGYYDGTGKLVLKVTGGQNTKNFEFDALTTAPLSFVLDPQEMTLTFTNGNPKVTFVDTSGSDASGYGTDYLYLYYADDAFVPTKDMKPSVIKSLTAVKLLANGDGTFSADIKANPKAAFRIIDTLGATPDANIVWGPSTGGILTLVDAHSVGIGTAETGSTQTAGWWKFPTGRTDIYTVTFDPSKKQLKISRDADSQFAYLIGTPTGWEYPSLVNADLYENWKLRATEKGFYGWFDIPAGNPQFRFDDGLNGWSGEFAFASAEWDFYIEPLDYSDGMNFDYMPGLGNWEIKNWPGGTMYIFINTIEKTITISQNPISEAGTIGAAILPPPVCEDIEFKRYDADSYIFDGTSNGVTTSIMMGQNIHLFSEKSPYAPSEPLWLGTNSLIPVGEPSEFNQYGVAEQAFEYTTGESTTEHLFKVPTLKNSRNMRVNHIILDKKDKKIYYVTNLNYHMIPGDQAGETPDHKTIADFKGVILPHNGSGAIVDVPAGKFDYVFHSFATGVNTFGGDIDIDFSNGVATCPGWYGYYTHHVTSTGWTGGKVIVTNERMMKYDDNVTMKARVGNNIFDLTGNGNGIFEGEVNLTSGYNGSHAMNLMLCYGDNTTDVIEINSPEFHNYTGGYVYENKASQPQFVDGEAETAIAFGNRNSFKLFFPEDTKLKVNVDLNNMTMKMSTPAEPIDVLTLTNSIGDESIITPTGSEDEVSFTGTSNDMDSFTVQNSEGKYLMPTAASMAPRKRGYRGLPAANAFGISKFKYEFSDTPYYWTAETSDVLEDYDWVNMIFDLKTQTAYVQHTGKATNWRMTGGKCNPDNYDNYYEYNAPFINDFEAFQQSADDLMTQVSPGIFKGTLKFYEVENQVFSIYKGLHFTHAINLYGDVDLSGMEVGESRTFFVKPNVGMSFSKIINNEPTACFNVEYDTNHYTLNMTRVSSAEVENITADADTLRIFATQGGLKVIASESVQVVVYNLLGMEVVNQRVPAGETLIALPTGYYIANGNKILCK